MTEREQNRLYNESLNYLLGRGVPKDEERAFALNKEAAKCGHGDAVLAMGWHYLNGVGVPRNIELAEKWYRDAARKGEARAMFSLGQIACENRDFSEAITWFRRASEAGHVRSLYWQGKLHWRGQGVETDRKTAMKLFHRAASEKVIEAQRVLRFLQRSRNSK
jgi:TPR repeat protein